MKLGISSYSLFGAMNEKRMDILQVIDWVAALGAKHIEIVPGLGYDIEEPGMVEKIVERVASHGMEISNYAVGGNFVGDEESWKAEVEKAKRHVDIANRLGVKKMRHDAGWRNPSEATAEQYTRDLPNIIKACQEIADYASQYGIITSVENHGYLVQGSERVLRLIQAVDRPNFKLTMDVGNFMCVDENSVAAVKKSIHQASMVHLKDFYLRPSYNNPGRGWFQTVSGNYLRGAIVGQGDIDMREVLRVVKASGYDGYVSIEFEGMEMSETGASIGFENVQRIWDEV